MIPPDEPLGTIQILKRVFTLHRRHGNPVTRNQFVLTNTYGHQYLVNDYGPRYRMHVIDRHGDEVRFNGMNRGLFAAYGVEA